MEGALRTSLKYLGVICAGVVCRVGLKMTNGGFNKLLHFDSLRLLLVFSGLFSSKHTVYKKGSCEFIQVQEESMFVPLVHIRVSS